MPVYLTLFEYLMHLGWTGSAFLCLFRLAMMPLCVSLTCLSRGPYLKLHISSHLLRLILSNELQLLHGYSIWLTHHLELSLLSKFIVYWSPLGILLPDPWYPQASQTLKPNSRWLLMLKVHPSKLYRSLSLPLSLPKSILNAFPIPDPQIVEIEESIGLGHSH